MTKTQKFERTQSHKAAPQHLLFAMNRRLDSNHKGLWEIFSGVLRTIHVKYCTFFTIVASQFVSHSVDCLVSSWYTVDSYQGSSLVLDEQSPCWDCCLILGIGLYLDAAVSTQVQ